MEKNAQAALFPPSPPFIDLNDEQQKTVDHFGTPLLILAGAGSGKTRAITAKISHLINEHRVPASAIVALTFTNKAANEMRERAEGLNSAASMATICTFHSFGFRFLKRCAHAVYTASESAGADFVAPNFTIYDTEDSYLLLKSLFPHDTKEKLVRMMRSIERAKNNGVTPEELVSMSEYDEEMIAYYQSYQRRLQEIGNVDFGDLILKPLSILRRHSSIREAEQQRVRALLIDEYQDTNYAQYQLVQQLYHKNMYLCAVGDDDQSIYAFRGSNVQHIINFKEHFYSATIMHLLHNYRSTQPILTLASHIIAQNEHRYQKTLYAEEQSGDVPRVVHVLDDYQEARFIADEILASADGDEQEVVIVYRVNAQARVFEGEFNRCGISYRLVGGMRFYEREEVKDVIAYLKFILNTQDEVSFRRIINKPVRGIGQVAVQKIVSAVATSDGNFFTILKNIIAETINIGSKARDGCRHVVHLVQCVRALFDQTGDTSQFLPSEIASVADVLRFLANKSGLWEYYETSDRKNGTFKINYIEEFISGAVDFPATQEGLSAFLEQVELQGEQEDKDHRTHRVTLITMHNTKGLEFDNVYIVGLQDGLFPLNVDRDELGHQDKNTLEEERRLFYVAVTRAKRQLTLITYTQRHQYGRVISSAPSQFLEEIDDTFVKHIHLHDSASAPRAHALGAVRSNKKNVYPNIAHTHAPWRAVGASNNSSIRDIDTTLDERPRFAVGVSVFHDDYGVGEVQSRKKDGLQYIIKVRFENGQLAHFIERYAKLEIVTSDP